MFNITLLQDSKYIEEEKERRREEEKDDLSRGTTSVTIQLVALDFVSSVISDTTKKIGNPNKNFKKK